MNQTKMSSALLQKRIFLYPVSLWLLSIFFAVVTIRLPGAVMEAASVRGIDDFSGVYPRLVPWLLAVIAAASIGMAGLLDRLLLSMLGSSFDRSAAGDRVSPRTHAARLAAFKDQVVRSAGTEAPNCVRAMAALVLALDISFVVYFAAYQHTVFTYSVDIMIGLNPMVLIEPLLLAVNAVSLFCILVSAQPWITAAAIYWGRENDWGGAFAAALLRAGAFALPAWLFQATQLTARATVTPQLLFTILLGVLACLGVISHLYRRQQAQP